MKKLKFRYIFLVLCICLTCFSLTLIGCGDGISVAPVSGVVLMDGEPLEGVIVTFSPKATEATAIVGPFSTAITDAEGKYTLKTKQKRLGAVVGPHSVSVQYVDYDPEAAGELNGLIKEKKSQGEDASKLIAKLKKSKSRKGIPEEFQTMQVEVPSNGFANLKIDINTN